MMRWRWGLSLILSSLRIRTLRQTLDVLPHYFSFHVFTLAVCCWDGVWVNIICLIHGIFCRDIVRSMHIRLRNQPPKFLNDIQIILNMIFNDITRGEQSDLSRSYSFYVLSWRCNVKIWNINNSMERHHCRGLFAYFWFTVVMNFIEMMITM